MPLEQLGDVREQACRVGAVVSAYQHLKTAFAIKAVNAAAAKEQAETAEAAVRKGRKELREGVLLLK